MGNIEGILGLIGKAAGAAGQVEAKVNEVIAAGQALQCSGKDKLQSATAVVITDSNVPKWANEKVIKSVIEIVVTISNMIIKRNILSGAGVLIGEVATLVDAVKEKEGD